MKYYKLFAILILAGMMACSGEKKEKGSEESVETVLPDETNGRGNFNPLLAGFAGVNNRKNSVQHRRHVLLHHVDIVPQQIDKRIPVEAAHRRLLAAGQPQDVYKRQKCPTAR